jgi:hypothetical protein
MIASMSSQSQHLGYFSLVFQSSCHLLQKAIPGWYCFSPEYFFFIIPFPLNSLAYLYHHTNCTVFEFPIFAHSLVFLANGCFLRPKDVPIPKEGLAHRGYSVYLLNERMKKCMYGFGICYLHSSLLSHFSSLRIRLPILPASWMDHIRWY